MRIAWAGLLLLGSVRSLAGQAATVEIGVAAVGVGSDPVLAGIGPTARIALSRELGVLATGLGGRRGDRWVGRGELQLQLRFAERFRPSRAWYLASGVAGTTGRDGGGYLVAGLGLERPISRRVVWIGEAGVGGGARLLVGIRGRLGKRR